MAFNLRVREEFKRTVRARMSVWEAMERLSELVDNSDPDVSTSLLPLLDKVPRACAHCVLSFEMVFLMSLLPLSGSGLALTCFS